MLGREAESSRPPAFCPPREQTPDQPLPPERPGSPGKVSRGSEPGRPFRCTIAYILRAREGAHESGCTAYFFDSPPRAARSAGPGLFFRGEVRIESRVIADEIARQDARFLAPEPDDDAARPLPCRALPHRIPSGIFARGAGIAQLVERQLPKLDVAGSNPVARSKHVAFTSLRCVPAPATQTSSLPSVGRLFASRASGSAWDEMHALTAYPSRSMPENIGRPASAIRNP